MLQHGLEQKQMYLAQGSSYQLGLCPVTASSHLFFKKKNPLYPRFSALTINDDDDDGCSSDDNDDDDDDDDDDDVSQI